MKKLPLWLLLFFFLVTGCRFPGMVRPSSTTPKGPVQYGFMRVAIRWPQKLVTQGIPDSAGYLRLRVFKDGALCQIKDPDDATRDLDLDEIYPRGSAGSISANSYRLPIGTGYLVEVRAYKSCPYKDVPVSDLTQARLIRARGPRDGSGRFTYAPFAQDNDARIVAEGIQPNQTITLPSFDPTGKSTTNNLTITLDQTVLVAGIGGSEGSNTPVGVDPGIDLGGASGYPNFLGDARFRELNNPQGLFFDKALVDGQPKNQLYFCDNSGIEWIDSSGSLRVFQAQTNTDLVGDGRHALNATIGREPGRIVDADSGIYLNDGGNSRLRFIEDASQKITSKIVYTDNSLTVSNLYYGVPIPYTSLKVNKPTDIARGRSGAGQDITYIVDDKALLKNVNGGNWSIVAGDVPYKVSGVASDSVFPLNAPADIDPSALLFRNNDLVVADRTGSSGNLYVFPHGGGNHQVYALPGEAAYAPVDLAMGPDNNSVYVLCDQAVIQYHIDGNGTADPSPTVIIAPDGPVQLQLPSVLTSGHAASRFNISSPSGLAVHEDNLYFSLGAYIYKISGLSGTPQVDLFAGNGGGGVIRDGDLATGAPFQAPDRLLSKGGDLYVMDANDLVVYKIESLDGKVYRYAGGGLMGGTMVRPAAITYSAQRGRIYVAAKGKDRFTEHAIWEINPSDFSSRMVAGNHWALSENNLYVKEPVGIAADRGGNVFFANTGKNQISKVAFDKNAVISPLVEARTDPNPVVVAGTGTSGKTPLSSYGSGINARLVQLSGPTTVRVYDPTDGGTDEEIYFLDKGNKRICKLVRDKDNLAGTVTDPEPRIITTAVGDGEGSPTNGAIATTVSITPSDFDLDAYGNLYVAAGSQIWFVDRKYGTMQLLYPRSGNGVGAFSSISVNIATDKVLEIYFTIQDNQQIRKLFP